jgi:hypothetical protein
MTNRYNVFAYLQSVRIPKQSGYKSSLLNTNNREVQQRVSPEKLTIDDRPIFKRNRDRAGTFDNMPVGQDMSTFIENHTGANSLAPIQIDSDFYDRRCQKIHQFRGSEDSTVGSSRVNYLVNTRTK